MNWNAWLKGLGLAVVGAAAGAATQALNNKLQNGKDAPPVTGSSIAANAAVGSIVAVLGYLVQSPLPTNPPNVKA